MIVAIPRWQGITCILVSNGKPCAGNRMARDRHHRHAAADSEQARKKPNQHAERKVGEEPDVDVFHAGADHAAIRFAAMPQVYVQAR